jgi:hypothetical protein
MTFGLQSHPGRKASVLSSAPLAPGNFSRFRVLYFAVTGAVREGWGSGEKDRSTTNG